MRDSSYDYIPLIGGGGGSRSIRAAASDTALDHNVIDELFRFRGRAPRGLTRVGLCSRNNYQTLLFSTLCLITPKMPPGKKKKNSGFHPAEAVRPLDDKLASPLTLSIFKMNAPQSRK